MCPKCRGEKMQCQVKFACHIHTLKVNAKFNTRIQFNLFYVSCSLAKRYLARHLTLLSNKWGMKWYSWSSFKYFFLSFSFNELCIERGLSRGFTWCKSTHSLIYWWVIDQTHFFFRLLTSEGKLSTREVHSICGV